MAHSVGYWVDLSTVTLNDDSMTSTIHAMPYGKYEHPVYGEIEFTPETVDQIVANVNGKVRGTDLDIDYDHKAKTSEAAGWVKAAEKRDNGLWLTVQWTQEAWKKIKDRAYRYFSPEFIDEWKHPKTGQVHKNVLFGGGITNRPFLKDILPLNMSELFAEQHQQEGTGMDPKKLRQLLGLPEDATDEQVETALQERSAGGGPGNGDGDNTDDQGQGDGTQQGSGQPGQPAPPQQVAASEGLSQEVIQLAEKSPAIKALVEAVTGLQQTVKTQGAALQLADAASKVTKLSEPVNHRTLPPAVKQQLTEILMDAPKALSDKIVAAFETLNKTGYVQLGEHGQSGGADDANGSADSLKRFSDEVTKVMESDKLSYADAVDRVASLKPELFEEYRQNSYAFREA